MRIGWTSLALVVACAASPRQVVIGPPPPAATQAVLAGPLCNGTSCACRVGDAGAGVPDRPGYKRFEVRMSSPHPLWITVGDHRLYKDAERAEACFYLDLPAGDAALEMRASARDGVSAAWSIHELGARTGSWYRTFRFGCGDPGACTFDELAARKAELRVPTYDRCGSVKVKNVQWDTSRAPDHPHPGELVVRATLDIYRFEPDRPAGADCSRRQAAGFAAPAEAAPAEAAPAEAAPAP